MENHVKVDRCQMQVFDIYPFFMGVSPKIRSNDIVSDFSVILNHNHADNFEVIIDSNDDVIIVLIQRDQTALRLLSENTIFLT